MNFTHRAVAATLSATALTLTLGALPANAAEAGTATTGTTTVEAPPSRKGYWPLESASGGLSPNAQAGAQPLALHGNPWIYWSDGLWDTPALVGGGELRLDGDGDWAQTATAPVSGDGSFTIAARARLNAADGRTQTVLSLPGAGADRIAVRYQPANGRWEAVVATEDRADAPRVVVSDDQRLPSTDPSGSGDHLAVVFDASAGELRLYVNGQRAAIGTAADTTSWQATGGLQVGRSATGGEHFAGAVDEVRAYSGAVGSTTIQQLSALTALPEL
ncbi:hypothetical protein GCM10010387_59690 [Streptomyces inusitatus]|uniref:LamG-like jellyroll fold domain-containing protein n=1 Tax=Streptomyces inusitatus TaxID=68221 RepID=A0A918V2C3_9ACTN|nr:LamG domain-containing protein [Streptomyces inusitatus]GGZ57911.1 hypothetical protein GCM10010387_59690 [Streptomyces inusitatus]